jgi:hypothetical protein
MGLGRLIARFNRWFAPAAVEQATSVPAQPTGLDAQVGLGEIEEAEQGEQTPEERESS